MAAIKTSVITTYVGTAAERAAMSTTGLKAGSTFEESDTYMKYVWSGSTWFISSTSISGSYLSTIDENLQSSLGQNGGKYIATTDATTPTAGHFFTAIQVISDCVITCIGNITGITAVSLSAGTIIYGNYTSITLASGSVIGYYGVS